MNLYKIAAETTSPGLFGALGLNWKSFILNGIAFLVVVAILKRFVYPSLIKAIDGRMADMTAVDSLKAQAQMSLDEAASEASKLVKEARAASDDILATTKSEASALAEELRAKAEVQAARIVAESREQLAQDIEAARKVLKHETVKLVAMASESVIGEKLDNKHDVELIERSLAVK